MKISGILPALLLATITCASAQVTVEVTQEQQQFLPGESLKVAVRITNLSGQVLHLGGEENWLTFEIETREGTVVSKLGDVPVLGQFTLESSKAAIKRLDLAPYFMLSQPGIYQIVATLRIREWNRELNSLPKSFDLIQGVKIWEQEVGIPNASGASNGEPDIRRYILQQANYIRGQIRLYFRVTDQYGKPFRVVNLGPMASFGRPEPQVDRYNNLHVLHLEGASTYSYSVFDLQGELLKHQTYETVDSRPRLRLDNEGNVTVAGGMRRILASDFPAPKEDDTVDVPPLLPPKLGTQATNQLSSAKPDH